jgi:hypothetical protein
MPRTERQVDRLGFFVQKKSGQVTAMGFSKVQAAVILLISQLKKTICFVCTKHNE